MSTRLLRSLALTVLVAGSAQAVADSEPSAFEMASSLAALGPRTPGTVAHARAQELLLERLQAAGAEDVARSYDPLAGTANLEGVLPGTGEGEIVLAAHYDTTALSAGALDDASGCGVILAVLRELRRTPRRHRVRAVFFDGEERGLRGSRAWLERLDRSGKDRVLAAIHLDVVGLAAPRSPVVLGLTPAGASLRTHSPAWLVHAVLRAGDAVGFRFLPADPFHPFAGQLLLRTVGTPYGSDVVSFLAAGVPSVLLSDFSLLRPYEPLHSADDDVGRLDAERLEAWVAAASALVRRLDALEGRPRWDEDYLVLARRVWIRRDLVWLGFVLWVALVLRSRPGRWAGAGAAERRARGRAYLPGYVFRFSLLGVVFWMPALGAALVYPAALAGLFEPRNPARRWAVQVAALLPVTLWLGLILWAAARGTAVAYELSLAKTALMLTVLGTFSWQLWTPRSSFIGRRPSVVSRPSSAGERSHDS